jgi:hypothetical protein
MFYMMNLPNWMSSKESLEYNPTAISVSIEVLAGCVNNNPVK